MREAGGMDPITSKMESNKALAEQCRQTLKEAVAKLDEEQHDFEVCSAIASLIYACVSLCVCVCVCVCVYILVYVSLFLYFSSFISLHGSSSLFSSLSLEWLAIVKTTLFLHFCLVFLVVAGHTSWRAMETTALCGTD